MSEVARLYATIGAEDTEFQRKMAGAGQSIDRFDSTSAEAALGADDSEARSRIAGVDRELDAIDETTATADVHADTSQAESGLERLRRKFSEVRAEGAQGLITGAAAGATMFALANLQRGVEMVADAIGDSIGAASDLNETLSKSKVIFGDSAAEVEAWGDAAAEAFGQSKTQAIEARATLGNLFTTMDLGKDAVLEMSGNIVELASDLASFNNIPVDVALEKLRSGLIGQAEPLRTVGVLLTETAVKAKAVELGLVGANQELSEGVKVQARYALILEQTKTAQGDFAKTSDGLANKSRILDAKLADLSASFGQILLPVMTGFVGFITDTAIPAIIAIGTTVGEILTPLGRLADAIGAVADAGQDFLPWTHADKIKKDAEDLAERLGALEQRGVDAAETWAKLEALKPPLAFGATGDAADDLLLSLHGLATTPVPQAMGELGDAMDDLLLSLHPIALAIREIAQEPGAAVDQLRTDAQAFGAALYPISDASETVRLDVEGDLNSVLQSIVDMSNPTAAAAKAYAKALKDPIDISDRMELLRDEIERVAPDLNSESPNVRAAAQLYTKQMKDELAILEHDTIDFALATGKALPEALDDQREAARKAAEASREAVIAELRETVGEAQTWATRTGAAYADYLGRSEEAIRLGAVKALSGAKRVMAAYSPPGPESPLHDIDKWGYRTGETWAEWFAKGVGTAQAKLASELGALSAGFSSWEEAFTQGGLGAAQDFIRTEEARPTGGHYENPSPGVWNWIPDDAAAAPEPTTTMARPSNSGSGDWASVPAAGSAGGNTIIQVDLKVFVEGGIVDPHGDLAYQIGTALLPAIQRAAADQGIVTGGATSGTSHIHPIAGS